MTTSRQNTQIAFRDFTTRFKLFVDKYPDLISTTLSNIFTMRLIGNKTHGDLAEIAIVEFINQFMYDFRSIHVGKELYRSKSAEEDIVITNEISAIEFPVSLKAYGDGPLQLSTDKTSAMFRRLEQEGATINGQRKIRSLLAESAFDDFKKINVLPLIYNEKKQQCNIMVFDYGMVRKNTATITKEDRGRGRIHPVYKFYDAQDQYICEVRYGDATANALQRGLWTNTKNALACFDSLTNGWIEYSHNHVLVALFSHALVSSSQGHASALAIIKGDILRLKNTSGLT